MASKRKRVKVTRTKRTVQPVGGKAAPPGSAGRSRGIMDHPNQSPPADRMYMSPVVGRRGRAAVRPEKPVSSKPGMQSRIRQNESSRTQDGDFVLELTVFHVPASPRRRSF